MKSTMRQKVLAIEHGIMAYILPPCRTAPMHITSLKDLHCFCRFAAGEPGARDPYHDSRCGVGAVAHFEGLLDKEDILARWRRVMQIEPNIVVFIENVKTRGDGITPTSGEHDDGESENIVAAMEAAREALAAVVSLSPPQ